MPRKGKKRKLRQVPSDVEDDAPPGADEALQVQEGAPQDQQAVSLPAAKAKAFCPTEQGGASHVTISEETGQDI
jgi:hypothetical protein